jgi:hypothetical protein
MYTHVSKCKNNEIIKNKITFPRYSRISHLKGFEITAFNYNTRLRNWVGILTYDKAQVSVRTLAGNSWVS